MSRPRFEIPPGKVLVLYDGECVLCSRTVRFLIRQDPKRHLLFAANQSLLGKRFWSDYGIQEDPASTLAVLDSEHAYTKGDAVLRLLPLLRKRLAIFRISILLPRGLRNRLYDAIAARRHRLVQGATCERFSPEDRARFVESE